MPMVSQMLISKFLSKADVQVPLVLHIRGVSLDQGRGNEEPKWLLHFHEHRKAMKLANITLRYLEQTLGPNSDGWINKKVQVYVDPQVMMAGQMVGGVRLRVAKSQAMPPGGLPPMAGAPTPGYRPPAAPANWQPPPQQGYGQPPPPAGADFDQSTGEIPMPPGAAADPDFDDDIPF